MQSSALCRRASYGRPAAFGGRVQRRQRAVVAAVAAAGGAQCARSRRDASLSLLAFGALLTLPVSPASATAVCADQDTEGAADECRAAELQKDGGPREDYAKFEGRSARLASGVPVSKIDDEYTRTTLDLAGRLEAYFEIDPYDKGRVPLIKGIKTDSQTWVTKYARGGSVRKQSARRFYIAVDAVLGHLASNGLAPFPARKAATVRASIEEAKALLADAK